MAHKSQTERDTWDLSYYTGVRAQVVMEQLFETSNRSKEGCFFAMVLTYDSSATTQHIPDDS
jgi:hypothetical protein